MLNYFYCCEINLRHPQVEKSISDELKKVMLSDDATTAVITSRPFNDNVTAYRSLEADVQKRLKQIVAVDKNVQIARINETNPLHLASITDIEERKAVDEKYAAYISEWDHDTMMRITCTTEELQFDDDGDLINLPKDTSEHVMRCYIRSYDDGIILPPGTFLTNNCTSSIH